MTSPLSVGEHEVMLLPDMGLLIDTVFADIDRAARRAWLECYIFNPGLLGDELVKRLAAAVARGVDVRLLYDPLGSQESPPEWFEGMRTLGIDARPYRPSSLPGLPGALPRDHSRIILGDDAAYTGGAAWGDQWLPRERGGEGWHDACCRIQGPLVGDFVEIFEARWAEAGDPELPLANFDTGERHAPLRLVCDAATAGPSRIYQRHLEAFRNARTRIWLENSYFYPPAEMLEILIAAGHRGVDVRLLLPGETDLPIVKRAARADYGDWLENGWRLWEYAPSVLHTKFAVVDDDWCSVGTFNANAMSVSVTHELNLFAEDPAFVAVLAEQFERDLSRAEPVTPAQIADRPMMQRVADAMARDALHVIEDVLDDLHAKGDGER